VHIDLTQSPPDIRTINCFPSIGLNIQMPSTRSSKHLKTSSASDAAPGIQSTRTGILSMPHELMLELLQYLGPGMGLPNRMPDSFNGRIMPYPLNGERRTALHALSQTCRVPCLFFLPLAWECLDTCSAKYDDVAIGYGSQVWDLQSQSIFQNLKSKSKGLQYVHHFFDASAQPSTTRLAPP
jgi:hypothetical protein